MIVDTEDKLDDLLESIEAPDRIRPVFVVALPDGSEDTEDAPIDPFALARRTIGIGPRVRPSVLCLVQIH